MDEKFPFSQESQLGSDLHCGIQHRLEAILLLAGMGAGKAVCHHDLSRT